MFGKFEFSKMKEQDVREAIVTPLLYRLGYKESTVNNIIREFPLKHPYFKIGRRNVPVTYKPDYILEVDNKIRWVLDAKAPSEDLDDIDCINQAYSYAAHPEVRGQYFALFNGLRLDVYVTLMYSSYSPPVISAKYEELERKFPILDNILGPIAIRRDFKPVTIDTGEPLGIGLRSYATIIKGTIIYKSEDVRLRAMDGFTATILGGAVWRDDNGNIVCDINTCAPYANLQELNRNLGLDRFQIKTDNKKISTNPKEPNVFKWSNTIVIPKGTDIPIMGSITQHIPFDIKCTGSAVAEGFLENNEFKGKFVVKYDNTILYPESNLGKCHIPSTQAAYSFELNGEFCAELQR